MKSSLTSLTVRMMMEKSRTTIGKPEGAAVVMTVMEEVVVTMTLMVTTETQVGGGREPVWTMSPPT
jgi:hypothetical protein